MLKGPVEEHGKRRLTGVLAKANAMRDDTRKQMEAQADHAQGRRDKLAQKLAKLRAPLQEWIGAGFPEDKALRAKAEEYLDLLKELIDAGQAGAVCQMGLAEEDD